MSLIKFSESGWKAESQYNNNSMVKSLLFRIPPPRVLVTGRMDMGISGLDNLGNWLFEDAQLLGEIIAGTCTAEEVTGSVAGLVGILIIAGAKVEIGISTSGVFVAGVAVWITVETIGNEVAVGLTVGCGMASGAQLASPKISKLFKRKYFNADMVPPPVCVSSLHYDCQTGMTPGSGQKEIDTSHPPCPD
jgi:hypothetical protein